MVGWGWGIWPEWINLTFLRNEDSLWNRNPVAAPSRGKEHWLGSGYQWLHLHGLDQKRTQKFRELLGSHSREDNGTWHRLTAHLLYSEHDCHHWTDEEITMEKSLKLLKILGQELVKHISKFWVLMPHPKLCPYRKFLSSLREWEHLTPCLPIYSGVCLSLWKLIYLLDSMQGR